MLELALQQHRHLTSPSELQEDVLKEKHSKEVLQRVLNGEASEGEGHGGGQVEGTDHP